MQDRFANRQNMHLTVLRLLDEPEFQDVWKDKAPTAFTASAAEFRTLVASLTDLITAQQTATTGYAEAKEREEEELETIAHEIGQNLAQWFEDNGREGDAAQIDLSAHAWSRLRDAALISKAQLLQQKLAEALATDAASLESYGLTAADATQLAKETKDFADITADPSAAISRRRALSLALRPRFQEASKLLQKMDRLVLRFRRSAAGAVFVAAWEASRIVRDLGGSAPSAASTPTSIP